MGTRLKTARPTLRKIKGKNMGVKEAGRRRRSREAVRARTRLLTGPAREMRAASFLGFFRLYGSN